MNPAVAVLGATGQVGLFAIAGLLQAGREVVALTRQPVNNTDTAMAGLRRLGLSQLDELWSDAVNSDGRRALLSCGPVALARELLEREPRCGWERAVVVGTTSTLSKSSSPDGHERQLMAEILSTLEAIRRRCAADGIPLTVLHPTLVYGCGMDQNLSRVYHWIERRGFAPVAADASGLRQPLHVADFAGALVRALQLNPPPELDSPICGGSTLDYREMVGRLFDAAGRKRRFLRLPPAAFSLVAGLSKLIPGSGVVNREMFRRQAQDLVFDDRLAREQLGHSPRPFQPTPADYRLPAEVEQIRHALLEQL